jgi:hypothetical protein
LKWDNIQVNYPKWKRNNLVAVDSVEGGAEVADSAVEEEEVDEVAADSAADEEEVDAVVADSVADAAVEVLEADEAEVVVDSERSDRSAAVVVVKTKKSNSIKYKINF